ncbi:MAG: glucokinase [Bacteroidetes bacterium]|nr:glucokinase [Bacteroidota bacterium]
MSSPVILSGDVGGTKTHLAVYAARGDELIPVFERTYRSRDFNGLPAVLKAMLDERPTEVTAATFGIAGPIVEHRSKLTNLGWEVDGREVADCLKLKHVGLLNDLEAMAYGTLRLRENERVVLQKGKRQERRTIAVIAAGTGLGEAGLLWDGRRYLAIPTEGGHTDFGPRNELEIELLRFLLGRHKRVSYERIVCGQGLKNTYDFFRQRSGVPEPEWLAAELAGGDPAAAISRAGSSGKDVVCKEALDLFVSLYGAEAGNLALKLCSTGGVFVGGGIAPKLLPLIQGGAFMHSFVFKGRYQPLLEQMPVEVILNEKAALIGAAHFAQVFEMQ